MYKKLLPRLQCLDTLNVMKYATKQKKSKNYLLLYLYLYIFRFDEAYYSGTLNWMTEPSTCSQVFI